MLIKLAKDKENKHSVAGMGLVGGAMGATAGAALAPSVGEGIGHSRVRAAQGHVQTLKDLITGLPDHAKSLSEGMTGKTLERHMVANKQVIADVVNTQRHVAGSAKKNISPAAIERWSKGYAANIAKKSGLVEAGHAISAAGVKYSGEARLAENAMDILKGAVGIGGEHMVQNRVSKVRKLGPIIGGAIGLGVLGGGAAISNMTETKEK